MVNGCCGRRRKVRNQDQRVAWGGETAGRRIVNGRGASGLRELIASYSGDFEPEMAGLSTGNMHYWGIYNDNTDN